MVITVLRAPYSGAGTMAPVHGRWYLPTTALLSFFFFLSHQQEQAQGTGGAVSWIPTQSQNSLLAQLASISESELSSADVALKTRAILGIIPYQQIAQWLADLQADPARRTLNVRWQSQDAKCSLNRPECTKALSVTINEFSYGAADASDCQALALISVDTLLPRHAVLTDGSNSYLPSGNPQYLVQASPNSTAGACTYVVAYPPATVQLASLACNDACRNSPCLQCADSASEVTAQSACESGPGIPASMQAALEGAAQCLAGGAISPAGRFQCNIQTSSNASACGSLQCFPGAATVQLESGERCRMRDLRVGDRVRAVGPTGKQIFSPVYFFGHQDATVRPGYLHIRLQQLPEVTGQTLSRASLHTSDRLLKLSARHFVPVSKCAHTACGVWSAREMRRAQDVAVGDLLWADAGVKGVLQLHRVVAIELEHDWGAYNPYTLEGNLIVDGVLASSHSDWLLDPLMDALGLTHWLPATYQALFAPLRLAYHAFGPERMHLVESAAAFSITKTPSPAVFSVVAAATSMIAIVFSLTRVVSALSH